MWGRRLQQLLRRLPYSPDLRLVSSRLASFAVRNANAAETTVAAARAESAQQIRASAEGRCVALARCRNGRKETGEQCDEEKCGL